MPTIKGGKMSETNQLTIKGIVIPQHKTAADWETSDYVPAAGEKIVYDADDTIAYTRVKHGDGEKLAKDLPFTADPTVKDWARQDTVPNGIWLEDSEMPEGYYVGIIPGETPFEMVTEMYYHNVVLAFRDPRIDGSSDDKKRDGAFSVNFTIINNDADSYGFDFNSSTSDPPRDKDNVNKATMSPEQAW